VENIDDVYEKCMKVGVMLMGGPPTTHKIDDCKKDRKHEVMEKRIAWWIHDKFLKGVTNETKKGPTDPKRVRRLVEVN
jgi:hypothetical protein